MLSSIYHVKCTSHHHTTTGSHHDQDRQLDARQISDPQPLGGGFAMFALLVSYPDAPLTFIFLFGGGSGYETTGLQAMWALMFVGLEGTFF